MLDGEEVKQIIYSVIEEIGRKKIQTEITSSIESSQKYIDIIMAKSITNIASKSNDDDYYEKMQIFSTLAMLRKDENKILVCLIQRIPTDYSPSSVCICQFTTRHNPENEEIIAFFLLLKLLIRQKRKKQLMKIKKIHQNLKNENYLNYFYIQVSYIHNHIILVDIFILFMDCMIY